MLHLAAMPSCSVSRRAVLPTLLMLSFGNCLAQTPAVTSFSGGSGLLGITASAQTAGWTFTASSNLIVSAIGFYAPNPLVSSHQVGLWTSGGVLLAATTVQTNSPLTGSWRYAAITPVSLTSGQTYVVASDITFPFTDPYEGVPTSGSVTTNGLVSITSVVVSAPSSGFTFPNTVQPGMIGWFGPNMLVVAAPTPTPTPGVPITPAGLALIGVGLLAVGLMVPRYRRSTVIR